MSRYLFLSSNRPLQSSQIRYSRLKSSIKYLILSLFILTFSTACVSISGPNKPPVAKKGKLDLRNWDFEKDGAVKLDGEWQFFWNKLYQPEAFQKETLPEKTGLFHIPRLWNGYTVNGQQLSGHGVATFRLEVKISDYRKNLALKITDMATAYRIWVNDELVLSNGVVGESSETMVPQFLPKYTDISLSSNTLFLTLQVSNFYHRKGGIWQSIRLGTDEDLREQRENTLYFDLFMLGSLLIMAFYNIGLFVFRRKDPSPLYLGIVCFLAGLRSVLVGERFLIQQFPDFSWEIFQKLEYMTFFLGITFFVLFVEVLFQDFSKRVTRFMVWMGVLFSLFTLVTPTRIFSYELPLYHAIFLAVSLYSLYAFGQILLNKREGAIWIILGVLVLLVTVLIDILAVMFIVPVFNVSPTGLFLFLLFQSLALSNRFYKAFDSLETHSLELYNTGKQKDELLSALTESEKKFRELVENIDDVFFTVDLAGKFTYVSPVAARVFEYKPESVLGRISINYIVEDDSKKVFKAFYDTQKGNVNQLECRVKSQLGDIRWTRFNLRPIYASNQIIGIQGFISDITESRKAQQLMLQTEKMASIGGMAAGLAHEINNPLAGILLANQNIIRRLSIDEETNHQIANQLGLDLAVLQVYLEQRNIFSYLSGIKESGDRAAEIIRNMLIFSRKSDSQKSQVSLNIILDTALELAKADFDMKRSYDIKNISLIKEYSNEEPMAYCNKTEIEQVVLNLVKNAVQALFNHSSASPKIILRTKKNNAQVEFEVEDNGPGIDDSQRLKIFEPFYTTKPEGEGTGLGLSVSYLIVTKNHQGMIEVDSLPKKGTRFIVSLPLNHDD